LYAATALSSEEDMGSHDGTPLTEIAALQFADDFRVADLAL
jgi:hypothetical protein